ncbi:MAG: GH3 auxin-responsive promoter family protein, partial [Anaerolineae bacterium]
LEFIPEEEHLRSRADSKHQPETLLLDEVASGERYEVVATNFRGGAFVRYRIGDLVEITGLRNERVDIDLPQMRFHSRADDVIDLGGFTRLTEKTIWQAIEDSAIEYVDWVVAKESNGDVPVLRIYLEPVDGKVEPEQAATEIHSALARLDPDYEQVEKMLGWNPARVSMLASGTFHRYLEEQKAAGADPAHLKPRHISPPTEVLKRLTTPGEET